jgi:hypothetical protein
VPQAEPWRTRCAATGELVVVLLLAATTASVARHPVPLPRSPGHRGAPAVCVAGCRRRGGRAFWPGLASSETGLGLLQRVVALACYRALLGCYVFGFGPTVTTTSCGRATTSTVCPSHPKAPHSFVLRTRLPPGPAPRDVPQPGSSTHVAQHLIAAVNITGHCSAPAGLCSSTGARGCGHA